MSNDSSGIGSTNATGDGRLAEQHDPRFWAEFDGAYRALLASLRVQADGAHGRHARGAMKIRTRDLLVLANGIGELLLFSQQVRGPILPSVVHEPAHPAPG